VNAGILDITYWRKCHCEDVVDDVEVSMYLYNARRPFKQRSWVPEQYRIFEDLLLGRSLDDLNLVKERGNTLAEVVL
jgi:hypothetical protein